MAGKSDLERAGPLQQLHEQEAGPAPAVGVDHRVEGVDPLGGLARVDVGQLVGDPVEQHVCMLTPPVPRRKSGRGPVRLATAGSGAVVHKRHDPAGRWRNEPLVVYTDGSCLGNPGPGGWAWAVPGGRYASGAEPAHHQPAMEITAALEALRALAPADGPGPAIEVVSDSTYVVNCFRHRWWAGWQRRGWKNTPGQAGGQPGPVGAAARAGPRPGPSVALRAG